MFKDFYGFVKWKDNLKYLMDMYPGATFVTEDILINSPIT